MADFSNLESHSFKRTFWQLSLFLFAFLFLVILDVSFNHLIERLQESTQQERSRLFIGGLVVDKLAKIESNFYRMATTRGVKSQLLIHQKIQNNIKKIRHYLLVLERGGVITEEIRLNIDSQEKMTKEVTYHPSDKKNTAFLIGIIELAPTLSEIEKKVTNLSQYVQNRDSQRVKNNQKQWSSAVHLLKAFLKKSPPFFARIHENANRMVFESTRRLQNLEQQTQSQKKLYHSIEIIIVIFIIFSILLIAYIFARQFDKSTNQLKQALQSAEDAEKLQRESLEFLKHVTDAMGEGVYALDKQGECIFVNKKAEELLGWSRDELWEKNIHNTIHFQTSDGKEIPEHKCPIIMSIDHGDVYESENEIFTRKDGTVFPISIISEPLTIQSEIIGSVAVFQDITQRKQTEIALHNAKQQAEQANVMKSEFLSNMSHELRTPMNAIIGLSHLLSDTLQTQKQQDFVNNILTASDTLLALINNVLDLSKIEAGKMEIEKVEFSIDSLLKKLVILTNTKIQQKPIKIYYLVAPDVPAKIIGDPLRVHQILLNLIFNAIKFTEHGKIIISLSLQSNNNNQPQLLFRVKDTGIGMNEKQQKNLFNAFMQADGSTTRKYGGTGLGLNICQQLSNLIGGKISVNSQLATGSSFYFSIPLETKEHNEKKIESAVNKLSKNNILLYQPDSTLRHFLQQLFSEMKLSYQLITEKNELLDYMDKNIFNSKKEDNDAIEHHSDLLIIDETICTELQDKIQAAYKIPSIEKPLLFFTGLTADNHLFNLYGNQRLQQIDNPFTAARILEALTNTDSTESEKKKTSIKQFGASVLLVEDNKVNQLVAKKLLKRHGLTVIVANNGQEALNILESDKLFDLIFMDIQMPVLDGISASKKIRENPSLNDLPIIALTAHALQEEIQQFFSVGINDHLAKPLTPDALNEILNKWLT